MEDNTKERLFNSTVEILNHYYKSKVLKNGVKLVIVLEENNISSYITKKDIETIKTDNE